MDDKIKSETPLDILVREIMQDPQQSYVVPVVLTNPDKLIVAAKNSWSERAKRSNQQEAIRSGWDDIEINVSPGNVDRALRFMDTLIKCLRTRGCTFLIEGRYSYAILNDVKFRICCRDKLKKIVIKDRWERTELHSTGTLSFKADIFETIEWKDGKILLEDQIPKILARLNLEADRIREERKNRQIYWDQRREEERLLQEAQQRKEKELASFKELLQEARRWREATMLRSYIKEKSKIPCTLNEEQITWMKWANQKADWYDPLVEMEDDMLMNVDRETLTFKKS